MMLFWSCSSFVGWGQLQINGTQSTAGTSIYFGDLTPLEKDEAKKGIVIHAGQEFVINENINFDKDSEILLKAAHSKLTITNSTLIMGENSLIKLENYCRQTLTIFNSQLMTEGKIWQGIRGFGNFSGPSSSCNFSNGAVIPYTTKPSIGSNGNCAESEWLGVLNPEMSLITINYSLITNANIGVQADWYQFVRVRDSEFKNCEIGVWIGEHAAFNSNVHPSFIMACDFTWDNNLLFPENNLKHIVLASSIDPNVFTNGPEGVRIGGCNFFNKNETDNSWENRGVGIYARNANFTLSKDGSKCCSDDGKCPDNCYPAPKQNRGNHFKYLGIGINYESNIGNNFASRFSEFDNCVFGIKVKDFGLSHSSSRIGDNTFTIDKSTIETYFPTNYTSGNVIKLLHLEGTADFGVYDNTFSHDLQYIACITSKDPNLQYTNFIRNNTFTNPDQVAKTCGPNMVAIDLYGDNNHLDITCNTFVNHVYDVKINQNAFLDDIPNMNLARNFYPPPANQNGGFFYSANNWSILPPMENNSPLNKWKTEGCASNVFIHQDAPFIKVHSRIQSVNLSTIPQFEFHSFNKLVNPPTSYTDPDWPFPMCYDINAKNCVDCNTTCDKLENEPRTLIGIEKFERNIYFKLFPNPSTHKTHITISPQFYNSDNKIVIYDIMGKVVAAFNNVPATFEFNLKNHQISKGIYFVSYQTEGINSVNKLMAQ